MERSRDQIAEILSSFFAEMRQWELDSAAGYRSTKRCEQSLEDVKVNAIDALQQIFRDYCISSDQPSRAQGGTLRFSLKPTYDPEKETIIDMEISNDNRAKVTTQQQWALRDQFVYRLSKCNNRWRIEDNRKRLDSEGQEVDWDL